MRVDTKKLSLIQHILLTEDEALLDQIRQLLAVVPQGQVIGWDSLSEVEKQAIEEGLAQSERGEGRAHEEVMAEYRAKYGI